MFNCTDIQYFVSLFVQVMLNAGPSFINVFHRLVASIMQEGRQRGEGDTGKASDADSDKNACYVTINLIWRGTYWFREELLDLVCQMKRG